MNQNHYPSLELCKKLTEAWFPYTENMYYSNWVVVNTKFINTVAYAWELFDYAKEEYVCPSIAELLDDIHSKWLFVSMWGWVIWWNEIDWYHIIDFIVHFHSLWRDSREMRIIKKSPAEWLAQMWLWLKENNYLK